MPALPPLGRERERKRYRPDDGQRDGTEDDSGVHGPEPQRSRNARAAAHHPGESGQSGDRPEDPADAEESLVALRLMDEAGAKDRPLVQRRNPKVIRNFRPPQKRPGKRPDDPADG